MLIYVSILFLIFSSSLFSLDRKVRALNKLLFVFISIFLVLLAGLRYEIGVDYDTYRTHYDYIPDVLHYYRYDASMEAGYEFVTSVFKFLNAPFYWITLFVASITFILLYRLSFRYSEYPIMTLLMFFSSMYWGQVMGQMRQPLAILLLYQFVFLIIKNKKVFFSFVAVLVAILFHKSLFLILFPLVLLNLRFQFRYYYIIFFASLIAGYFVLPLSDIIVNYLPEGILFRNAIVSYLTYLSNPIIFTTGMIERFILFIVITYLCAKYGVLQKDKMNLIFYNMYFYGICFYFLSIHISEIGARGSFVLTYSMFLLFPNILKSITSKSDYILFVVVIFLWSFYLSLDVFFRDELYIPYKSVVSWL